MNLPITYQGAEDPFEGDRTIWLRSLPAGARVTKATVRLTPKGGPQFTETFVFDTTADPGELLADDWGITKTPTQPGLFVEVDFHARRTLAAVQGTQGSNIGKVPETEVKGASLQVDMGGAYVGIANDATLLVPDKTPWVVTLSSEPASLPGVTVNKFKSSGQPEDPTNLENATLDVTKVTIRSLPTNVSLRLGDMPPFWTRLGELVTPRTSPDFAAVLNAFLAETSAEGGFYAVPFVVHSDTIARLDVELAIDYVVEKPVLPPYLPEVTLPYGYSGLPGIEEKLLTVKLPRGATITGTGGAVLGAFEASRIAFPKPDADGNEQGEGLFGPVNSGDEETSVVIVSPDRALAQPVEPKEETPVSRIDLPLANTESGVASLHLALQADADGKPSGEVLTSAEVNVEKPVPAGSAWGSAPLPTEFRFEKDKRYWLVLQSVSGKAYWEVGPGDPAAPLQASTDGGFSWRTAASEAGEKPLAALYRLRHTPERFTMPIHLRIGEEGKDAKRVDFDHLAPLGRVEFDVDFATKLKEYLESPATVSPCGSGNLLVNGSFDQPPHDDATRRLMGFDVGLGSELTGYTDLSRTVDLSVQRFIALSVSDCTPKRVDCAGSDPAHTSLGEIIAAINQAMGQDVASESKGRLHLGPHSTGYELVLHPWHRAELPQGWQRPAEAGGQIWRAKLPTVLLPELSEGLTAMLSRRVGAILEATENEPAMLSQSVPVAGGCAYVLRFLYRAFMASMPGAEVPYTLREPSWEVRWLDAGGQLILSEEKGLPVHFLEGFEEVTVTVLLIWVVDRLAKMLEGEVRLVAPPDATEAEIRFSQPPTGFLVLDDVSFTPTREVLRNGSFSQWEEESDHLWSPVGWTRLGGCLDPELDEETKQVAVVGAKLGGDGPEDAVLAQTVEVIAAERYELQVCARPVVPPSDDRATLPDHQRARLELHWLTDDGAIGEPVILPLDGHAFPTHAWAGTVPHGATHAEVRLIQPRGGGDLLVGSVSLSRADLVSVPLTFLAEAPGELTVSDLRVTYESPGPPTEPPPRPAVPGAARRQMAAAPQPLAVRRMVEPAAPRPRSPLAEHPVGIIAGVGKRFKGLLDDHFSALLEEEEHTTTLAELAALDPGVEIDGVSYDRRLEFKAAAEIIMGIHVEAAPFATSGDESLEDLLALTPAELARRAKQPLQRAEQLQRDLRGLRFLLNKGEFRSLHLSDLMPTTG